MNRILFVTQTHNVWGGMEQWLHHFSDWLIEQGWDVHTALPRGARFNDPDAFLTAHPHLHPVVLDVRSGSERSRVVALSNAIRWLDPDIVLPIASGAVFAAIESARRTGARARLIVPIRSLHPDLFCNVIDHISVVDQVVGVSRLIEAVLRRTLPREESDRIHYVRHGARPAHIRRSEGGDVLRIGFVGRLEESTKRVNDLSALRDELAGLGIRARIEIFGSGPDESELRLASASSSSVPMVLRGAMTQDALYGQAYPNLDILALFSPAEGSPNAVYEAMQHGVVPVVARFLGQAGERIVRDGETGFTFSVGDVRSAALTIAALAADRNLLERISSAAFGEVREDTAERMHRDWLRIFEVAMAIPPRPPSAGLELSLPAAGRLERLVPHGVADAFRRMTGHFFRHADGWGEWPGTAPASPECVASIDALIRELDAAELPGARFSPSG